MKNVAYSKSSIKALKRLPANDAKRIRSKINQYNDDPSSLFNNIKSLVGSNFMRLRVGDWRVIMNDAGDVLYIHKIGPHGDIYD